MVSLRLPPTFMVATPSSQPLMTLSRPTENWNGLPAIDRAVEFLAAQIIAVGDRRREVERAVLENGGDGALAEPHSCSLGSIDSNAVSYWQVGELSSQSLR